MGQAQHTPGPFKSVIPGFNKHIWARFIEDQRGNLIARINFANPVQSETEAIANGDLLAASPDLLKACEAMNFAFGYGSSATFDQRRQAIEATEKAIAKARGGA